jgi:hypothetical protein
MRRLYNFPPWCLSAAELEHVQRARALARQRSRLELQSHRDYTMQLCQASIGTALNAGNLSTGSAPFTKRACKCWQLRQWRLVTLTRRPADLGDRWNPHNVRAQLKQAGSLLAAWWRRVEWGRQVRDVHERKKRSRIAIRPAYGG